MRYFITGATGFIGGELVRILLEEGHHVVAVVRDPAKAHHLSAQGVELHAGDITERDSLRVPMRGADGVFHLAAWYKVGAKDSTMAQRINVEGTRNVLRLMDELEVPKGVYTSTLAVFSDTHGRLVDESYRYRGPHLSEYDRTKWEAHYEVALPMIEKGLPLVVVQPGLVYGPGDTSSVRTTLLQYLQGKLPMVPKRTAFCWGHVEDTAMGHGLAMAKGRPGESYIVAGEPFGLREALELAERITGVKAPRIHPGPGLMRALSGLMKPAAAIFNLPSDYHPESLRVLAGVTYLGSSEKARRELGYNPRPLEQGLRQTLLHEMEGLGMLEPQVA